MRQNQYIKINQEKFLLQFLKDDALLKELTFKTAANSLTGHRNYYSTYDIPAQDRREFERLFGRGANYSAEDITRITYGKKTLYETPPIQAEDMAERIEMGGMQLG